MSVLGHSMSPLNMTQPLGIWSIMANKVMSNIPKMGQLPTPMYSGHECSMNMIVHAFTVYISIYFPGLLLQNVDSLFCDSQTSMN